MSRIILLFTVFLLLVWPLKAQTVIWQEDFEDNGNTANGGAGRYTSDNDFYDPTTDDDYFGRIQGGTELFFLTDVSSGFIANSIVSYSGYNGDFFYAAEDVNDMGAAIGSPDGVSSKTLTITVDISSGETLTFKGLFASGQNASCGSSSYDGSDFIEVRYNVDGVGDVVGLRFSADIECSIPGDVINEPLHFDPNMDGDGGEGTLLTAEMQEFSFSIPDGNSVVISIVIRMDADSEEIAFDNLRIEALNVLEVSSELLKNNVSLYPNPSRGLITIKKSNTVQLTQANIYNVLGKHIKTFSLKDMVESKILDLEEITSGIYVIIINSKDGNSVTKKIIIE